MQAQKPDDDSRLFAALVAVLLVVVAIFAYSLIIGRAPESFTQVWIDSAPESARAGEQFAVSFTIDSHEAEPRAYSYSITAGNSALASGSIELQPAQKRTLPETISLSKIGTQKVLISITSQGKQAPYELWFWVNVGA